MSLLEDLRDAGWIACPECRTPPKRVATDDHEFVPGSNWTVEFVCPNCGEEFTWDAEMGRVETR